MAWNEATREGLEVALNESDVVGVRLDPTGAYVDVLLHVTALPESGPLATDGRRIMRLTEPAEVRFLLRRDGVGEEAGYQPAIPLADETAVEEFFDSLAWGGSIYGWRFFDLPELTSDWPETPSLRIAVRADRGTHTFYWFNECGVERDEGTAFCIEGTVTFEDLVVLDAEAREIPVERFIADGFRQWDALGAQDERLSVEAQRESQDGSPKWRKWAEVTDPRRVRRP
ncbi:hypothetical protein [Pimelobacter sp. 30-1]|uniref:hypothetical protein n=1 Tax=Pimelobacter sp. 30-1 TaxID=2004991 RepID=UPI001C0531D7|nr:hypothetical protein [Pimelobacter sp. 30-1]MBU2693959.1 hypothetical protein [Pimelobacter sp. 30-1]